MNKKKLAKLVAAQHLRNVLGAYTPEGDLEKMIGEIVTQEFGISDAEKDFFDAVKDKVGDLDLDDSDAYADLTRAVIETVDDMGLVSAD